MSRAKAQAAQNQSQSSAGFAAGFLLGQVTLTLILFAFIKFFVFGEAPSADERAAQRAAVRRQRTLSHSRQRTFSAALRPRPSSAVRRPRSEGGPTVQKLLEKTFYNVYGHQPESLDWFNVLVAQTVAQLRADAQEDEAVLSSMNALLNGPSKPDFLDDIRVTEISLGEEFPIFSNCRVIPVDEHGIPVKELSGRRGERLQARMDVDLSDVVTLGVETKLVLNYPRPAVAVLPVELAVSVVRFSGTLSLSFSSSPDDPDGPPSSAGAPPATPGTAGGTAAEKNEGHPLNPTGSSPTTLTFTFLDDYRLDLSVHSLIGSRSRLQDVPKIAQLIEARIHQWFDDRCVEPRFQQIVLPSLWPRKKNTRGGTAEETAVQDEDAELSSPLAPTVPNEARPVELPDPSSAAAAAAPPPQPPPAEITAEQRTRDWAVKHGKRKDDMSELEQAGAEMRDAEDRARRREQQQRTDPHHPNRDGSGLRMRSGLDRTASQRFERSGTGGGLRGAS